MSTDTNTGPLTWQEAKNAGGVWVFERWSWHNEGVRNVLLGTVDEPFDEYGIADEDDNWWCSLHVIQVLQGVGPQSGPILDGVKCRELRRPFDAEAVRVYGDLADEAESLRHQADELTRTADLVLTSDREEDE